MFEDRNNTDPDLLIRSILEGGREEVPERVWEGISEGLDRMERRRKTVLWWRRTGIGSAAAAALALLLVLGRGGKDGANLVPDAGDSGMIAVVEQEAVQTHTTDAWEEPEISIERMLAYNDAVREHNHNGNTADGGKTEEVEADEDGRQQEEMPETGIVQETEDVAETDIVSGKQDNDKGGTESVSNWETTDWTDEEESGKHRIRTSVTASGIAGTNNVQNRVKSGLLRQPSISKAPEKTGISESSSNSTYGVPLSFGAGVKVDFTDRWALGIGLNYSLLTRKFYGTYTQVGATGSIENSVSSDIRNSQQYIGVPVNVFYNFVDRGSINFYAYAGGTVEKCISDRYQVINTSIVHSEKVKGAQLSANVGIGVEFMLGKHLGIYIDPSLRYYFDCDQPKSVRTAQPLMLGFEMGLRARL